MRSECSIKSGFDEACEMKARKLLLFIYLYLLGKSE